MRLRPILFALTALLFFSPSRTDARGFQPTVFETQFYLSLSGYYGGTLDGRCGSGTRDALIKYLTKVPVATAVASCEQRDLLKINKALRKQLDSQLKASGKKLASPEVESNTGNTEGSKGARPIQAATKNSKDAGDPDGAPIGNNLFLTVIAVASAALAMLSAVLCVSLLHTRSISSNPVPETPQTKNEKDTQNEASVSVLPDDPALGRSTALLRFGDRGRTIDQVKRLYAVVMGFAVTNFFTNAYKCYAFYEDHHEILAAQMISFLTLIVVIFLGTERLLDRRYLDITKVLPPSRYLVLFDLVTQGATAAWFVVISDTFPPDKDSAVTFQGDFVGNLIILYILNSVVLFFNALVIMSERAKENKKPFNTTVFYHFSWIGANVLFTALLLPAAANTSFVREYLLPNPSYGAFFAELFESKSSKMTALSVMLAFIHIVRFLLDFLICHEIYYPQATLPDVKKEKLFKFEG